MPKVHGRRRNPVCLCLLSRQAQVRQAFEKSDIEAFPKRTRIQYRYRRKDLFFRRSTGRLSGGVFLRERIPDVILAEQHFQEFDFPILQIGDAANYLNEWRLKRAAEIGEAVQVGKAGLLK